MSVPYNDFVLSTAYWDGYITDKQYHLCKKTLDEHPDVSALDLMKHNDWLTSDQVAVLEAKLAEELAKHQHQEAPRVQETPRVQESPRIATPTVASPQSQPTKPPPQPTVAAAAPRMQASPPPTPQPTVAQPKPVAVMPKVAAMQPKVAGTAMSPIVTANSVSNESFSLFDFLRFGAEAGASDIHLGVGAPGLMRRHGSLVPLFTGAQILSAADTERLWKSFLTPAQIELLKKEQSLEFSYAHPSAGRFRVSIVHQRKGWDLVFRTVNTKISTMKELGLPDVMKVFTQYHNGLVLVTGAVGTGKSTTLAAMVQEINMERHDHIITLEDPIEYVYKSAGCQITQREVHSHTNSFATALRASLREDPDVIVVGEMRDLETISLAITASETGHLVLATLHTSSAARTLDRVLDAFPVEQQGQIRTMVSESLRGIVSQQLIPRADGNGRALALEIMVNTPAIANLIRDAKTYMLPGQIQIGRKLGMRLMDESLMELVESGIISGGEAYDRAEQKKNFDKYI